MPVFRAKNSEVNVTFPFHVGFIATSSLTGQKPAEQEDKHQVEHQVPPGEHQVEHQVQPGKHQVETDLLGQHTDAILRVLAEGPVSSGDIFTAISVHNDRRAYLRHIKPLLGEGLVAMTNPENPRASNQKYFLTDRGRQLLETLTKSV